MTRDALAYRQMTDADLLARAGARDRAAFSEIVARHYRPVYRLVWRMTNGSAEAEDVAQDAFVRLWQNPAQIREAGALKGWLMRVASNGVIDRSRRPRHGALDDAPEPVDPQAGPDEPLDRREAARVVDRAIAALPERQRLALSLVYFEGLTNIAAAEVLEISVDAVESLLARARRSLKEGLSSEWRDLLGGLADN